MNTLLYNYITSIMEDNMAKYLSDIEIAQQAEMKVINTIADKIEIPDKYVENYGK